jgi:DNA-binding transcriptional regulator WhiA
MNTVEIAQIRDNIIFRKPELVEVRIVKVPRSNILNNYVRQTGRILYVSNDCLEASVKLESGKIIRFPIRHLQRVYRYEPSKVYESIRFVQSKNTDIEKETLNEVYDNLEQEQPETDTEESGDIYDSGDIIEDNEE